MRKIILKIEDDIDDDFAMRLINDVIDGGRVSETKYGETYSFVTSFFMKNGVDTYDVYCDRTKAGTDIISIYTRSK